MIPLHNLTTNTYTFKGGEPLIWIEFTKLSPNRAWERSEDLSEDAIKRVGIKKAAIKRTGKINKKDSFPSDKSKLTPSEMLAKASPHSSIRSSITDAIQEVKNTSEKAKKIAARTEKTVAALKSKVYTMGFGGGVLIVLGIAAIVLASLRLGCEPNLSY